MQGSRSRIAQILKANAMAIATPVVSQEAAEETATTQAADPAVEAPADAEVTDGEAAVAVDATAVAAPEAQGADVSNAEEVPTVADEAPVADVTAEVAAEAPADVNAIGDVQIEVPADTQEQATEAAAGDERAVEAAPVAAEEAPAVSAETFEDENSEGVPVEDVAVAVDASAGEAVADAGEQTAEVQETDAVVTAATNETPTAETADAIVSQEGAGMGFLAGMLPIVSVVYGVKVGSEVENLSKDLKALEKRRDELYKELANEIKAAERKVESKETKNVSNEGLTGAVLGGVLNFIPGLSVIPNTVLGFMSDEIPRKIQKVEREIAELERKIKDTIKNAKPQVSKEDVTAEQVSNEDVKKDSAHAGRAAGVAAGAIAGGWAGGPVGAVVGAYSGVIVGSIVDALNYLLNKEKHLKNSLEQARRIVADTESAIADIEKDIKHVEERGDAKAAKSLKLSLLELKTDLHNDQGEVVRLQNELKAIEVKRKHKEQLKNQVSKEDIAAEDVVVDDAGEPVAATDEPAATDAAEAAAADQVSEEGLKDVFQFLTSREKRLQWSVDQIPAAIKESEEGLAKAKADYEKAKTEADPETVNKLHAEVVVWENEVRDVKQEAVYWTKELEKIQAKKNKAHVSNESEIPTDDDADAEQPSASAAVAPVAAEEAATDEAVVYEPLPNDGVGEDIAEIDAAAGRVVDHQDCNDELTVVQESLEALAVSLEAALEEGGLTPQSAKFFNFAFEAYTQQLGEQIETYSPENYGGQTTRLRATMESAEKVKTVLENIWTAIKAIIAKIHEHLLQFYRQVQTGSQKLSVRAKHIHEAVQNAPAHAVNPTIDIRHWSKMISVDGKVAITKQNLEAIKQVVEDTVHFDTANLDQLIHDINALADNAQTGKAMEWTGIPAPKAFSHHAADNSLVSNMLPGGVVFVTTPDEVTKAYTFETQVKGDHVEVDTIDTLDHTVIEALAAFSIDLSALVDRATAAMDKGNRAAEGKLKNLKFADDLSADQVAIVKADLKIFQRRMSQMNRGSMAVLSYAVRVARAYLAIAETSLAQYRPEKQDAAE